MAKRKGRKPKQKGRKPKQKELTEEEKKTASQKEREAKQRAFLELLPKKAYHIGKTCDVLGIHRTNITYWRNTYEWFNEEYLNLMEYEKDDGEERLKLMAMGIPKIKDGKFVGWIEKPHYRALEKFLDTKVKDRGYGKMITINDERGEKISEKSSEELMGGILDGLDKFTEYEDEEDESDD